MNTPQLQSMWWRCGNLRTKLNCAPFRPVLSLQPAIQPSQPNYIAYLHYALTACGVSDPPETVVSDTVSAGFTSTAPMTHKVLRHPKPQAPDVSGKSARTACLHTCLSLCWTSAV